MVISNKLINKDFYQENEWRYVPPVTSVIYDSNFESDIEKDNKEVEKFVFQDKSSFYNAIRSNKAYNGLTHPMAKGEDGKYRPDFKHRYSIYHLRGSILCFQINIYFTKT